MRGVTLLAVLAATLAPAAAHAAPRGFVSATLAAPIPLAIYGYGHVDSTTHVQFVLDAQLDGAWLPWAGRTLGLGLWLEGLGSVAHSKSIHPRLGMLALGLELAWRRTFAPPHGPHLAVSLGAGPGVVLGWLVVDPETRHHTVAFGGRARATFAVAVARSWWLALAVGFDIESRPLDGSRWLATTLGATRYLTLGLGVTWAP